MSNEHDRQPAVIFNFYDPARAGPQGSVHACGGLTHGLRRGVTMSFSLVRLLAGGLVIAAVTSGALGQERHFDRHAMIEPHHPAERWEDSTLAVLGQKLFFDARLSRTG